MSQHLKHKKFAITAAIIGVIAAGVTGAYFVPAQTTLTTIPPTVQDIEEGKAIEIAQRFVREESPTFTFDGIGDTIDLVAVTAVASNPTEYEAVIKFTSAHGGFGNRDGQMLTQVITPHEIRILISEGIVISAVTDDVWDELNHQYVLKKPQSKLPSHDEPITPFDGEVTDYDSLVDSIKARGILVEPIDELEDSSFSVPVKVVSVGGADVQVFEFQNESDAQASSLTVSEDGTEIGTSVIRWIDTPHFYTKGKIIVLYVGHNPEIMNLLESILGKQFAGM